jgi:hypothetical protein
MDLEFGLAEAEPSHASEAEAAVPGSEDFAILPRMARTGGYPPPAFAVRLLG